MIIERMYRALKTLLVFLAGLFMMSCGENNPEPGTKPEITIDASCLEVFSSGIRVEAEPEGGTFTKEILFTATDKWTASITDDGTTGWVSVRPSSGAAGKATMTVSVTNNDSDSERRASVAITCGTVSKSFTVMQDGKTPVSSEPAIINVTKPEESGVTVVNYDIVEGTLEITAEEGKEPKVGDIICSGRTKEAPYGFFMKVESVKDASTRDYLLKRYILTAADISLYEFCQLAGITEPGWYPLIETEATFVNDEGTAIEPEQKDGPKLFSYHVPLEFKKTIKLDFKQDFTIPSLELYFDPSSVNVSVGCRAVIKNTETLHASIKGTIAKEKGDFYKKYGVQEFIIQHVYDLQVGLVPIIVTTQFKPSVPYELSLSGEVDLDILRSTKYNRLEFCYSMLTDKMEPIYPEKGYFYQDFDFKEKGPEFQPDENTVSAKLEGVASIGLDFEYSVGLYGGNLIDEDDIDKESLVKVSKFLSLGANAGYKLELKSSLGLEKELDGQGHNKVKVIDDNKLSSYIYGKLWTSVLKAEVAGMGLDFGKAEVEVKLFKQEFHFPNFFRDWRKLKVNSITRQDFINITANNSFPFGDWMFKESGYGFCLESSDGQDYWVLDVSNYPLAGENEKLDYDIPIPVDNLRRNVTYTVYPYSMISNFPFVEGEQMVCRKGVSFIISDNGELVTTTIDEVPGEVL